MSSLFPFPEVDGWHRQGPEPLDGDPCVMRVAYRAWYDWGPLVVTAYVADRAIPEIPDGPDSPVVGHVFDRKVAVMQSMVARETLYRDVQLLFQDTYPLGTRRGALRARRAGFYVEFLRPGPCRRVVLMLTGAKGHLVEVRVTQPGSELEREEAHLLPVMEAIGSSLAAG